MKSTNETSGQDDMMNSHSTAVDQTKSDTIVNLRDLLITGLMDMYWSENALLNAIPKMVKHATSSELATDLEVHLEETVDHVTRLDEVFELLNEKATSRICVAMEGLINEVDLILQEIEKGAVRDAGILAVAQKIEHYEIASYGTLINYAKTLGENASAYILKEILTEEEESFESLSELAEESINDKANHTDEDHTEMEMGQNDQEMNNNEHPEAVEDFTTVSAEEK